MMILPSWRPPHLTVHVAVYGANLRGANIERCQAAGADLREAGLRDIPWLLILELTLQPGTQFSQIRWDHPTDHNEKVPWSSDSTRPPGDN